MLEFELIDDTENIELELENNEETIDLTLTDYNDSEVRELIDDVDNKIDELETKTDNEYNQLSGVIENLQTNKADKTQVNSLSSQVSANTTQISQNKADISTLNTKVDNIHVPTKTSELTNDNGFIEDNNYVHTDNNYTTTEKNKLAGLNNYDDTIVKQDISNLQTNKADKSDLDDYATQADFQTVRNSINTEKARIDKLNIDLEDVVSYVDEVSESVPTQLSQLTDDTTHRVVTDVEKQTWNNKSNFSGSANDLSDKPTITYVEGVPNSSKVVELTNVTETIIGNKNIEDYGVPKFMPIDLSVYDTNTKNKQLKPYTQLPDGNYIVTSRGNIYFAGAGSYFAEVGTLIFKLDGYEVTLIGPDGPALYLYDEDNNEWTGGGFTTSDDVDTAIEMAMPLISNYKSVGVKTPDDFDTGLYIIDMSSGAMLPLTLSLNVEGTTQTYTPIENGTLIIKTKNNNFHVIGTEALFFEYDSTNSYYKEPVDLLNADFVTSSDLSNYYNKTQVDNKVNVTVEETTFTSVQDIIDTLINDFAEALSQKADTTSIPKFYYGTSTTAATAQAKVVECDGFVLEQGATISVLFTNAQTYNGAPTLNVNGSGAKTIQYKQGTNGIRYMWQAGAVIDFTYNGTHWVMHRSDLASTSYYGLTKLATSAVSTSTSTALTPASLNNLSQNMVSGAPLYSSSATYEVGDRVRYGYYTYKCITAITTAEAWTAAHWEALDPLQEQIDALKAEIEALKNNS